MNQHRKIESAATQTILAAIYTRVSTDEGLDQEFNSLDAQREACEAYILSQRHEGWKLVGRSYDDGGFSGGTMIRPALQRLLDDVRGGKIDTIVVYKIDRLTRALADFSRIVDVLDAHDASFISVTQSFSTTTSMGRLTLNVLLSFAQFEREVGAERVRDKIASSKKKGMWMGGVVPLGFDVRERCLVVNEREAKTVRRIFNLYLKLGSVVELEAKLRGLGVRSKRSISRRGVERGGNFFSRGALYTLLRNSIYVGDISHKGERYPGRHDAIVGKELFDKVQASLADNRVRRRHRGDAARPSLFAGILFDGEGRRMVPSHTTRKSRRFRYYVAKSGEGKTRFSMPAHDLEKAVLSVLGDWLGDLHQLSELFSAELAADQVQEMLQKASQLSSKLVNGRIADRREAMLLIVDRVTVTETDLHVCLKPEGVAEALGVSDAINSDGMFDLSVPCGLARRSNEVRLVLQAKDEGPRIDPALVKLVVKGWMAREALVGGGGKCLAEIAREQDHEPHYFSVLVKLGYLAPDLVEEILEGRHPARLDRQRLARMRKLPMDWQAQRKLFDRYRSNEVRPLSRRSS